MLIRWLRLDTNKRCCVWRLYGRFTGLILCSSCFGIGAYVARMNYFDFQYQMTDLVASDDYRTDFDQVYPLFLSFSINIRRYALVFLVLGSIELFFFGFAKLMILDRLSQFITTQSEILKRWVASGRCFMVIFVACSAAGFTADMVAAVYMSIGNGYEIEAFDLLTHNVSHNNNQDEFADLLRLASESTAIAYSALFVQHFCQVANDLITLVAFVAAGVACSRHMTSMLKSAAECMVDPADFGRELKRRIIGTVGAVFVSSMVKTVVSIMVALANQLTEQSTVTTDDLFATDDLLCTDYCDSACYNAYTRMFWWMIFAPQFELICNLISSPLTMLVALWGMTPRVIVTDEHSGMAAPMLSP
jgi:hypothetical protein